MASIDIQFYYSHGIIAYINGSEVFRDNMPHGIINHSTLATNSYSYSSYRGIIIPAFYAQFNQSVSSHANLCHIRFNYMYRFNMIGMEGRNKGGLMNLVSEGYPTLSLIALSINNLRFAPPQSNQHFIGVLISYHRFIVTVEMDRINRND
ncbi:hypothetical protein WA171_003693 [Blastocystis sp. BT1]